MAKSNNSNNKKNNSNNNNKRQAAAGGNVPKSLPRSDGAWLDQGDVNQLMLLSLEMSTQERLFYEADLLCMARGYTLVHGDNLIPVMGAFLGSLGALMSAPPLTQLLSSSAIMEAVTRDPRAIWMQHDDLTVFHTHALVRQLLLLATTVYTAPKQQILLRYYLLHEDAQIGPDMFLMAPPLDMAYSNLVAQAVNFNQAGIKPYHLLFTIVLPNEDLFEFAGVDNVLNVHILLDYYDSHEQGWHEQVSHATDTELEMESQASIAEARRLLYAAYEPSDCNGLSLSALLASRGAAP